MKIQKSSMLKLFTSTFMISLSTSGGYAIVALMKNKFVNDYQWLSEDEMMDYLTIAQSAPGPIAINTSILIGYHTNGFIGAIVSMLGTTLPPLIIMSIVANCYEQFKDIIWIRYVMKGMGAGVAALLISVTVDMFINLSKKYSMFSYILFIGAFILIKFTNINILYIALACALLGIVKVFSLKEDN